LRRTKDQVLKELPEKTTITIPFVIEDKLQAKYRKEAEPAMERVLRMKRERDEWKALLEVMSIPDQKKYIAAHAAEAQKKSKLSNTMIEDLEKVKQAAVDVKLDQATQFIIDTQRQEGKVLVFATHHSTIDRMKIALEKESIRTDVIDGRVNMAARGPIKDSFQDGNLEILLCGIRAASEGLTLTASHTVIFVELDFNPARHDQALSRVHRFSQKHAVTVYYLIALGTIEESLAKMIEAKREVTNSALGEEAQTLLEDGILDSIVMDMANGIAPKVAT
jgi:SNF2 family DNA or RNA helicase